MNLLKITSSILLFLIFSVGTVAQADNAFLSYRGTYKVIDRRCDPKPEPIAWCDEDTVSIGDKADDESHSTAELRFHRQDIVSIFYLKAANSDVFKEDILSEPNRVIFKSFSKADQGQWSIILEKNTDGAFGLTDYYRPKNGNMPYDRFFVLKKVN